MKNLRNINSANTETKVVFKNVTTNDVVCKKNVFKKIRNGLNQTYSKLKLNFVSCSLNQFKFVHNSGHSN